MKAIEKSSIELYIEEIGSGTCSPLALRDEDELLRRASGGDEAARERIMKANLRYVVSVAKKYARGSVDLDDLVQAGNEALFESFETFDYGKFKKSGCSRFITYAGRRICQKIAMEAKGGIDVSITEGKFKDLRRLRKEMSSMECESEAERVERAADSLGMNRKSAMRLYRTAEQASSLEYSAESGDRSLEERMPSETFAAPDEEALMRTNAELLRKLVERLGCIEGKVITLAYGLDGGEPLNYPAIGQRLGYTREGIRIVHNRAISRLREEMGLAA